MENVKMNVEVEEMEEQEKPYDVAKLAAGCVIIAATGLIGYKIGHFRGWNKAWNQFGAGLNTMWLVDPELKERMYKAIMDVQCRFGK